MLQSPLLPVCTGAGSGGGLTLPYMCFKKAWVRPAEHRLALLRCKSRALTLAPNNCLEASPANSCTDFHTELLVPPLLTCLAASMDTSPASSAGRSSAMKVGPLERQGHVCLAGWLGARHGAGAGSLRTKLYQQLLVTGASARGAGCCCCQERRTMQRCWQALRC